MSIKYNKFQKFTLILIAIIFSIVIYCINSNLFDTLKLSQLNEDTKTNEEKFNFDEKAKLLSRNRRLADINGEKEFAPKLIHQQQNNYFDLLPNQPQTIECPIEANPQAHIKWFKDNQLLMSQMPHSEQHGNELIINELNDDDTGNYHCEGTNYLGTTISEKFKLTVQTSIYDENVHLEPKQTEVGVDQQVEFTCTIPATNIKDSRKITTTTTTTTRQRHRQQQQQHQIIRPEVSWKRDGKKLLVKWLDDGEELADAKSRFVARQIFPTSQQQQQQLKFVLTILGAQLKDDNSTFTCLYQIPQSVESSAAAAAAVAVAVATSFNNKPELAHESNKVLLRVYSEVLKDKTKIINSNDNNGGAIDLQDPNLGPPIYDLMNKTTQLLDNTIEQQANNNNNNNSKNILDEKNNNSNHSGRRSLREILLDLFEFAKPILIVFGILFLFCILILIQFIYLKNRKSRNQNRYIKHSGSLNNNLSQQQQQQQQLIYTNNSSAFCYNLNNGSSSGSNSSCSGSALTKNNNNSSGGIDPMLNSLMGRTLSVPGIGGVGVGKKYMSYRDHLRKVAAATTNDNFNNNNNNNDNRNILSTISNGGCDFLDGNFVSQLQQQLQLESATAACSNITSEQEQFFLNNTNSTNNNNFFRPNLYNQSLAAREQARSLLQASEHMRSLSNLNHISAIQKQQQQQACNKLQQQHQQLANTNGSHLNLPLSFGFGQQQQQTTNNNNNNSQPLWLNETLGIMTQQQLFNGNGNGNNASNRHHNPLRGTSNNNNNNNNNNLSKQDEQYQLVNCSSISPSSSSSLGRSSNGTSTATTSNNKINNNSTKQGVFLLNNNGRPLQSTKESLSNHYSTIELNDDDDDDDEDRYEEVDNNGGDSENSNNNRIVSRTSTFVVRNGQEELETTNKNSNGKLNDNSTGLINRTNFGSKKRQSIDNNNNKSKYRDQLSPYAVSSICGSMTTNNNQQPPPINSEAMKALNEQFDINQLMLIEDINKDNKKSLPTFEIPPPPP